MTRTVARPVDSNSRSLARIGLWGNFGTLNLGNECTLAAVIANLRRLQPATELLCICPEPSDVERRHGIAAVQLRTPSAPAAHAALPGAVRKILRLGREVRAWSAAVRTARRVDALLIAGTGVLTDDGEGTFGLPYELLKWSIAARIAGCRLLYVSVGVEGISSAVARAMLRRALALADYRSCRDRHSHQLLLENGIPVAGDPVYPDLAFSLAGAGAADAPAGRRVVAVGVYNFRGRGLGGAEDARAYGGYLSALGSFVLWLIERGYAVRIVIGDYAYDDSVRLDLRAELEGRGVVLASLPFDDEPARAYERVIEQLDAADLVIATRFHNVLLGLMLGKPVISVSYDPKNDALMGEVGLQRFCQSIEYLSLERLCEQFAELERAAPALRKQILAKGATYRAALDEQYARLISVSAS